MFTSIVESLSTVVELLLNFLFTYGRRYKVSHELRRASGTDNNHTNHKEIDHESVNSLGGDHVVLVHGGFVDGSGWENVYRLLKKDGYNVTIVQNPTLTLADDVAVTRRAIAQAARHCHPRRPLLWRRRDLRSRQRPEGRGPRLHRCVRAGQRRVGAALIKDPPPGAPVPPILPPQDGFLFLDKAKFAASFAADVDPANRQFMADSQVPWGVERS